MMVKERKIMNYNKLYNPEIQGEFLENIRKQKSYATYEAYYRWLVKISKYEKLMGKNLYEFGRDDDISMLKNLWIESPKTGNPLKTVCKQYVDYALLVRGLGQGNINHFNSIKYEDIKEIVKQTLYSKKYITQNEYKIILRELLDNLDKVPIILAWYGVIGKALFDILNFKKSNINENDNTITVPSTGEVVQIEKWEIDILKKAAEQEYYRDQFKLIDSEYVIRPVITFRKLSQMRGYCSKSTVNTRLWNAFNDLEIGNENANSITLTTIFHSHIANNLIEKENQLGREITGFRELEAELKQYNIPSQVYTIKDAIKFIKEKLKVENEKSIEIEELYY